MDWMLAQISTPVNEAGATEMLANLSMDRVAMIALALTVVRLILLRPTASAHPGRPPEIPSFARGVAEILESLIIAGVLVFLIIRPFFVQAFYIPSESMEPTLLGHDAGVLGHTDTVHDHIFVNKMVYRYSEPQHGDIIVFKAPKEADAEHQPPQENVLIKRLIGTPGDTIEVKPEMVQKDGMEVLGAAVYRNGKRLNEPYIKEPMQTQNANATVGVGQPLKLGKNQLFVMGDNRNNSNDGRYWGLLDRNRVIGKASLIFWPLNRIRALH